MVPESVFKQDDIEDNAAENTPATKSPGSPGIALPTSITKKGSSWSAFETSFEVTGSQDS